MGSRILAVLTALALALPAQARGLRFTCLVTGRRNLVACCCTGSMTEACAGKALPATPSCGS